MNIYEVDYRHDWLETILKGLKSGFDVVENLQKTERWFDGLWSLEFSEPAVGMGFVGSQAYLLGVVADVGRIKGKNGQDLKNFVRSEKIHLYSYDSFPLISSHSWSEPNRVD